MPQSGILTLVLVDNVTIAYGRSRGFSQSADMIDISSATSGQDRVFLPSMRSATISFDGLFDETISSTAGYDLLNDKMKAGTKVTVKFGTTVNGEKKYSYDAYIQSLERTAPFDGEETFSCTFQLSGAQNETTT